MIVKFVKYLIDKDVLDKQYEEDSIYGLTIMLEKIVAYVVLFCIAFIVRKLLLLSGDEYNILEKFILGAWLALSVW